MPTVYACSFLVAFIWCLCKKYESFKIPRHYLYMYLLEVLLSQFEWKSKDSLTETRLTYRYRSLSFVTPTNFPLLYGGWPMMSRIQCTRRCQSITCTIYGMINVCMLIRRGCRRQWGELRYSVKGRREVSVCWFHLNDAYNCVCVHYVQLSRR